MPRSTACASVLCLVLGAFPAMAGPVTLLSRADPARPSETAGGPGEVAAVSADGRYVVFLSSADNLLPAVDDTNAMRDVFFHDRVAGTTVLVSHVAGDPLTAGDGEASSVALSADGRWVAFVSGATDLVAGQVDNAVPGSFFASDVFLWDRDTGVTILVSHPPGLPTTTTGDCRTAPGISADGGRIVFSSGAEDLMAGQSDDVFSIDVFLYDRIAGTNTLVSHVSGAATTAAGSASQPAISADGNWVVFESSAESLVAGQADVNGSSDLFLYDRITGTNVLMSHAPGAPATTANDSSFFSRISADGSRIAYVSFATDLVTGQVDGNSDLDVFLYDRAAGTNTLVSRSTASATTTGNAYSEDLELSADGRYVAFESGASNLVAGDTNPFQDVFFYDRIAGTTTLVSRGGAPAVGDSFSPTLSADGAWVGFLSDVTNLVAGQSDAPSSLDVFLWSRASGSITLVTRTPGSATTAAGGDATDLRISSDGSWLALASRSEGLVAGIDDFNGVDDVFLYARATGINNLLTSRGGAASAAAGGTVAYWTRTAMSNDGRSVAFTSASPSFPGVTDGNNETDVFLYDRISGTARLVSHANGSPSTAADAGSREPVVSTDGSVVVFESDASNLVPGQSTGALRQLYLFDRTTGGITLVSHAAASPSIPSNGGIWGLGLYAVSGDGRWVAFSDFGTNLVAGQVDGNGGGDIFLFDRATGTNVLVSHASSSSTQAADGFSNVPSISADGRYVAFESSASNLVPGQVGAGGIFLYDRVAGTTIRASSSGTYPLAISGDGRWVAFTSDATDVVPGQVDTSSTSDVFLWDRTSGSTLLVSRTPASPATTGDGLSSLGTISPNPPVVSADGRWVAFYSGATNLVPGQTGSSAVFLFDRVAGTVTLASRSAASPTATGNGDSREPALSADGRFVAFASRATDLVPGQVDLNFGDDLFLYDRIAGTTSLVSHAVSSVTASGRIETTFQPARPGGDGAWIAFSSPSPDLVADDHDGTSDAFLHANPLPRDFFAVSPCRILDTRLAGQGPALTSGLRRTIPGHGICGIPVTARAIAANVTITQPTGAGFLIFHAGDIAPETASTINFSPGQTRSNNAILTLAYDGTGAFAVTPSVGGNGTVHLIVDVSGWFE